MDRRLIRDLDILTLQLFVAICEEGTLTRAAKREAIAPSAVSKRLADLETALNAELFHRGATGMTLTSAGHTMLRHSRSMLENIEIVGSELKEYACGIRGFVRVRANIAAIVQFLPEDLRSFMSSKADIRIDLEERSSRTAVEEVERGAADFGIVSSIIDCPTLTSVLYRKHRLVLVVDESNPLSERSDVSIRETLEYDHIALHADSALYNLLAAYAAHTAVPLKLKLHVPGFDALFRMVQAGLGVGVVPDGAFAAIGRPMGLKAVPLSDDWAQRQLNIVHRGDHALSTAGRMFLDHLCNAGEISGSLIRRPGITINLPEWVRAAPARVLQ